jgi:hypothetical protein
MRGDEPGTDNADRRAGGSRLEWSQSFLFTMTF